MITGSNTGVGFETAKTLAANHGYEVIIACRSEEKGIAAVNAINQAVVSAGKENESDNSTSGGDNNKFNTGKALFLRPVDLSNLDSVREFCQLVNDQYDTIDVLINNAGKNSAADTTTCERQQVEISWR